MLGRGAGLARPGRRPPGDGRGTTVRDAALATLAQQIVWQRGLINDDSRLRSALGRATMLKVPLVALNIYTNHTQPHRPDGGGLPGSGAARAAEGGVKAPAPQARRPSEPFTALDELVAMFMTNGPYCAMGTAQRAARR